MKSYIDITGKYLRTQKKRSVLTVIGIILSVALITGIGTIFLSMYDTNMRSTIKNYGDYYAAIPQVPGDKAEVLAKNIQVQNAGFSQDVGIAAYAENVKNGMDTPYKYIDIKAVDTGALQMLPGYDLEDGRIPAAPDEIAVDDWVLKYLPEGTKIGSTVTFNMGTRSLPDGTVISDASTSDPNEVFTETGEKQFTIVGTLKPRYISTLNFSNAVTWLDGANLPASEKVTTYLKLKSVRNAQKQILGIADANGLHTAKGEENAVAFNDHILRLYAQSVSETFNSSFMTVIGIIVLMVVIATIAVIYNAFNISVVERVSQFGLLRCVGSTPAQIRNIVFREALILGAIGIPIGVICGTLAMGVVFNIISVIAPNMFLGGGSVNGLRLILSPWLVIASVIVGAATIYLSALLPARKAAKISPMEAVRGTGSIKKEKFRKTDKHRVVLKLLGAEGWMAWKNLGRNRKRFYITVLSMVISIVLFIVFSSLVGYAYKSGAVDTTTMPSYLIMPRNGSDKMDAGALSDIAAMPGVDYMLMYSDAYAEADIPAGKMNARAAGIVSGNGASVNNDGSTHLLNCNIVSYSDDELEALARILKLGSFDKEAFNRGDGVILINGGQLIDRSAKKQVLTDVTELKPGDSVKVTATTYAGDQPEYVTRDLGVLATAEQGPPQYVRNQSGGVFMIVSQKLFSEMAPMESFPTRAMIMMKPGADHTAVKARLDGYMEKNPNLNLTDAQELAKNYNQTWVVMSIFLYGFVVVISLIGCLNIINTISTNIIIRTRELSILRAIGMSDGGVRRMVALESILHAAAAALVGSVFGTALSWVVYDSLMQVREFAWALPWQQILVAIGAAAIVAVVSGAIPLRRINSGIIMEGIRGEE